MSVLIDVSCGVGSWPFEPLPCAGADGLRSMMQKEGIDRALVVPLEGLCYKNPHLVIDMHFDRLRPYPELIPVPTIHPLVGDWRHMLEKTRQRGAPAVTLYPGYHGYEPRCRELGELLGACGRMGLAVMISLCVEDPRRQHRVLRAPDVDLDAVLDSIEPHAGLTVVLAGIKQIGDPGRRERIVNRAGTYIETSFLEYMDTLRADNCSLDGHYERILFGTHAPFFYPRANLLKLEAVKDDPGVRERISWLNARRALNLDS